MPKKFKFIQKYICKIKTPRSFSSVISTCKHPRTASFALGRTTSREADHHGENPRKDEAATLYDIDQFLLENFKSLYVENRDEIHNRREMEQNGDEIELVKGNEKKKLDRPSNLCGSRRFFVPIGPSSSSLMEEARLSFRRRSDKVEGVAGAGAGGSSSTSTISEILYNSEDDDDSSDDDDEDGDYVNDEYMTIKTYSWNPYNDFLVSMEEMIESKLEEDREIDWDFMEELLVCYLSLNDKKSRKFIISAFVDLIVSLRKPSEKPNIRRPGGQRKLAGVARRKRRGRRNQGMLLQN
ncbi:transcription repressor OFP14 [Euphorbia lathyris]|uniref:transcription repressor OFP14 n=1 Tax=Euphorbia lathyris TaxID=212925 RepID=UPI0033130FDE